MSDEDTITDWNDLQEDDFHDMEDMFEDDQTDEQIAESLNISVELVSRFRKENKERIIP